MAWEDGGDGMAGVVVGGTVMGEVGAGEGEGEVVGMTGTGGVVKAKEEVDRGHLEATRTITAITGTVPHPSLVYYPKTFHRISCFLLLM